ncbi:hypothetical protein LA080_011896 [Diaporthe eres]|nr:hypothetical protein LA080_011896 [Diaporthe eres]
MRRKLQNLHPLLCRMLEPGTKLSASSHSGDTCGRKLLYRKPQVRHRGCLYRNTPNGFSSDLMVAAHRIQSKTNLRALALVKQRETSQLKIPGNTRHPYHLMGMPVQLAQRAILPKIVEVGNETDQRITHLPETRQYDQDIADTVAGSPEKVGTLGNTLLGALRPGNNGKDVDMSDQGAASPVKLNQYPPGVNEMGDLRFGRTGSYDTRYDEGQYAERDYDSDDHQFTTDYLHDMARIRNWRSGQ